MYLQEYRVKQLLMEYGIAVLPFAVAQTLEEVKLFLHAFAIHKATIHHQTERGVKQVACSKEAIVKLTKKFLEIEKKEPIVPNKVLIQEDTDVTFLGKIDIFVHYTKACIEIRGKINESFSYEINLDEVLSSECILALQNRPEIFTILEKAFQAFCAVQAIALSLDIVQRKDTQQYLVQDAQMFLDKKALSIKKELALLYDPSVYTPQEKIADQFDLQYRTLNGKIACMVTGIGLSCALIERLEKTGLSCASLLNLKTAVSKDRLHAGFRITLSDPQTEAILLYFLSSVMDCLVLAKDIQHVLEIHRINIPIVMRLEGKNAKAAEQLLRKCSVHIAYGLEDAVEKMQAIL